ncbi:MAG: DnaJ domain-containing protein [Microscillaceae bacterium]|nr:DnaJ domain-containing protein [Microscillaceae bacterium]MDW8460414.1 DnaJ domain-containing protein [Cytophagales bacterium]
MLTERFIRFLKSNLLELANKLEQLEQKAKRGEISFSDLLAQLFTNPIQRAIYEQLFAEQENKKSRSQDNTSTWNYEDYDLKSPFEKFDYYYQKYEQQQKQQQEEFERYYQEFKRQQQNKYQTNFNFAPSAKEKYYYDVLEVRQGATFDEIKEAYRKAMKKYHPDRFHGDAEKQKAAEQLSKEINEAYAYFEKKFGT